MKANIQSIPCFTKTAMCLLSLLLVLNTCFARDDPEFDEIPVYLTVAGVGHIEVPAIIYNEVAYLSVTNVFDFLKIKNTLSNGLDSLSGFYITPQNYFLIDKKHNRIVCGEKQFILKNSDIIISESNLFLRMDYFEKVFGLKCTFNFRSLTVLLTTTHELPVIREMRQEAMRNNMMHLTGERKADTNITGGRSLFHAGMADWSVITTQNSKGPNNTRLNLVLGTIIAGGETTIGLNYDSYSSFSERQQFYQWRLVNNDHQGLRQVIAGKIAAQSISSIFSPVVGVQFTNTPTTFRRSFGTYVLSDRTEPNWMVELYVNNVLVNYVKADASGFFTFDVPLVYGNSAVKLRFYGPYGEERSTEQNISIPFNFLPKGKFEYIVSAGMVEDTVHSRFSRASFSYGLGKRLTIGGGAEYLSSVSTGKAMPFVNASFRLGSNLLVSGDYVYGVRMKQVLSYRLPSNLQVEVAYTRYKKGQQAINNTFLEERRAVLSYPFRGKKLSLFSRMTVYQIILPASKFTTSTKYTNAEVLFSGVVFGVNANLTTYGLFTGTTNPYVYSNLSATFRLPSRILFTPQVQYEYNQHQIIGYKGEAGKYLSANGYVNIFYEKNYKSGFDGIGIGLRYDLSFAQMSLSARRSNNITTMVQAARGSLLYDRPTKCIAVNNRTSVGRGGLTIVAFLDLNGNGIRDNKEPKVAGLKAQLSAGRLMYNKRDSTILATDLEAYASYIVTLNTDGFENISWQIKKKVLSVMINPNQLRLVEIPVSVVGEVSGMVWKKGDKGRKGQGRVIVSFFNKDNVLAGQTLTEADGSFSYLGLAPGTYTAIIDQAQLDKLHFTALPGRISFAILNNKDGGVAGGLEFTLQPQ
jgi:hypothetical protein